MNPRKPTALKILNGSAEHHPERINRAEPQPDILTEAPPPPSYIRVGLHPVWYEYVASAMALRVLSTADLDALAATVLARAEYLTARRDPRQWRRASDAWKRWLAGLREFGLTPSARTRVHATPPAADDGIAALLRPRIDLR